MQGWESVFWLVGANAPTPPYGGGLAPPTPPLMVGASAPTPPLSRPGGLPKVQKVGFPQIPIIPANYKFQRFKDSLDSEKIILFSLN